jgi:hypothetical protein
MRQSLIAGMPTERREVQEKKPPLKQGIMLLFLFIAPEALD